MKEKETMFEVGDVLEINNPAMETARVLIAAVPDARDPFKHYECYMYKRKTTWGVFVTDYADRDESYLEKYGKKIGHMDISLLTKGHGTVPVCKNEPHDDEDYLILRHYCPCGKILHADWLYCPKCGRRIEWKMNEAEISDLNTEAV